MNAYYWVAPPKPDPDPAEHGNRARIALALGVVSLFIGPLGIIAWAVSSACLREIREGRMDPGGEMNAKCGRVLGIIATCLFAAKLTLFVPFLLITAD
jgi:hypothetical protein